MRATGFTQIPFLSYTKPEVRFRALLTDGAREVRFEKVESGRA